MTTEAPPPTEAVKLSASLNTSKRPTQPPKLLGVWRSTAICGNDISSSVLYVSALCAAQAGMLAPLVLLLVVLVLFLYRKIYAEVGSVLPLNGGTYTLLLNSTSKRVAAAAACLTLLSYLATAVISASEGMHYASNLWPGLNVQTATVLLLVGFAVLNIIGIGESSTVALVIFVVHLTALSLLIVLSSIALLKNPTILFENWRLPSSQGVGRSLFFGFAAAMLGISGFESSANFIEEQADGVFPKTLRNMWIVVAVVNPLVCFLAIGLIPLDRIRQVPPDLLAQMGTVASGKALATFISFDAAIVLSGAVLTSFVGVTGLMRRMALDDCLPRLLLRENRWRHTNHWIVLTFLVACISIYVVTQGKIEALASVYAIAFLSVMALFAIGNMLLKQRRAYLPRSVRASWPTVAVALVAVLIGLLGNVLLDPISVEIFQVYFVVILAFVTTMFMRRQLLRAALVVSDAVLQRSSRTGGWLHLRILESLRRVRHTPMVYLAKTPDLVLLNRVVLYVLANEQTSVLRIAHFPEPELEGPEHLAMRIKTIDALYPQLKIDLVQAKGRFEPEAVRQLAAELDVPKHHMFMGAPGRAFPHRIQDFGGVRLIL